MGKIVNVKSPTGCVHRAEDNRFSCKGSRRTLCNHKDYYRDFGSGYYHNWNDTDEEVTCKRCLKEMEPEVTARRHDIKWLDPDFEKKEVQAEVTVNSWYSFQGAVLTVADKQEKFILCAGNHHSGMMGIDGGTIPRMSEERRLWLHLVAQTYWSAIFNREMNYTWATLD